jgi:hypothetical protein
MNNIVYILVKISKTKLYKILYSAIDCRIIFIILLKDENQEENYYLRHS